LIVTLVLLGSVAWFAPPAFARRLEAGVPRQQHPWGQFKIGSWKRVRTVTETLDPTGKVANASVTETTTKLIDVDESGYTLRIDVSVEVAGKRFPAAPQVIRRSFTGESEGKEISVKRVGDDRLTINGRKIPCEVRQVTVNAETGKRITTVHYTEEIAPYVLKRETTSLDLEGKPTEVQSQVDVVAVDMPHQVLDESRPTSHVRIMHQQGKASTLTLEVHCAEVPGGVVAHTSKETDDTGRVIRRSTLELVAFGIGTGDDIDAQTARKVFHRSRHRRAR
jgi:hypothetical protein